MGPKTFPTIWGTYMKLVTNYQISAINNYWWQESDIWSQDSYRYAILWEAFLDPSDSYFLFADLVVGFYTHWTYMHIWSLWPTIRFLPSIVAEKNVTKNEHICSMCIKINKVSKQEVGIWWVQKRFPRYVYTHWTCICTFFVTFFSATIDGRNLIVGHKLYIGTPISWEAFFDPSDSYFLFAEERRYHKWALTHNS
jgi:hypothetical protein